MNHADRVLVCSPIDGARTGDSVLRVANCGHEVWISVGGQQVLAHSSATSTICMRCCPAVAEGDQIEIPREVHWDLIAEIGQAEADRVIAMVLSLVSAIRGEGRRDR